MRMSKNTETYARRISFLARLATIAAVVHLVSLLSASYASKIQCNHDYMKRKTIDCKKSNFDEASFTIAIAKESYLACSRVFDGEDYSIIPNFTETNTEFDSFSFINCPLPDVPLSWVIFKLGVPNPRSILFRARNNLKNTLTKNHFKGLQDVTRLDLSRNGLTDLPEDLFMDMDNLNRLYLRSNNIHLYPGLFKYIPKLEFLELAQNQLIEIPKGLFKHLPALKLLNLWVNKLSNFTGDEFDGLESLEELDLSHNKIQTLPSKIFNKTPNLRVISLVSNNLYFLPHDIFSKNPLLERIKMTFNQQNLRIVDSLPSMLSNLIKLNDINLSNCFIENIVDYTFWELRSLKKLSLSKNKLIELPIDFLRDQVNLVHLDLSGNLILIIPDETFRSLRQLKVLSLSRNRLEKLSRKIFGFLDSLEKLDIKYNNLQEVSCDTFSSTRQLLMVDMAFNNLSIQNCNVLAGKDLDDFGSMSPFWMLKKLELLNLRHNMVTEIFWDWKAILPNLRTLDLRFNRLLGISFPDINIISNNITMDLRNNNISEIDFAHAVDQNIKQRNSSAIKVFIDNNPFKCDRMLCHFAQYLNGTLDPNVRNLVTVLPENSKCASPDLLQGRLLTSLQSQELLCQLNKPSFPQSRKPVKGLCPKYCTCNVNDVFLVVNCSSISLADNIPLLPDISLKEYELNFTELHFENNMRSLSQLYNRNSKVYHQVTQLNVKGNNISSLVPNDIPNKIKILDLRNNSLTQIDNSVTDILNNSATLKEIWISGNPLECSCKNHNFFLFLQINFKKVKDFSDVTCSNGQKVKLLSLRDLCSTTPIVITLSIFIALVGLILGIFVALYYKYQKEIKVWLFAHNLCLQCITEKELDKDKFYDAFISFSHKDEDFVINKLVPELENGNNPFKICLHFRDWVAGEWISAQIARSIEDSRRTLVILSPNFLESVWGRMEFRVAHSYALKGGRAKVIVILYGDIGLTDKLDSELQTYLSTNTYIKWGDPWFWDKLRYALSHPQNKLFLNTQSKTRPNRINEKNKRFYTENRITGNNCLNNIESSNMLNSKTLKNDLKQNSKKGDV